MTHIYRDEIQDGPKIYKSKQVVLAMSSQTDAFIQEIIDGATAKERDKWDCRHGFALHVAHSYQPHRKAARQSWLQRF